MAADEQGIVRATSQAEVQFPLSSAGPTNADELELTDLVTIEGRSFFHATVPLDRRAVGGRRQMLHIFYPERQLADARWQAVWPPLVIGLVATVLIVAVATWTAGRLTRPIERLVAHTDTIASGNFTSLPLPDQDDEIRDLVAAINRMTSMLARYEENVRTSERLRTLGQLGGGIAHQVRNAATGCRMALDLHRADCTSGGDAAETLDVARRQLESIERYVQRFLTLGRRTARRWDRIDVAGLVNSIAALVRPTAHHAGVELTITVDAQVTEIMSDAEAIEQVLVNLLINAIDAVVQIPSGRAVGLRVTPDNTNLMIEVEDNGPGLSTEVQAHLFEPFATNKADGVGLGLVTARDAARSIGGELRLRSAGQPTIFQLWLPLTPPNQDA